MDYPDHHNGQHPQAQPIVYGPMTTYDMSTDWNPQMVHQSVIQAPQWPTTDAHAMPIDPNGPPPISDPCMHSAPHPQYTEYSTLQPTYWNSDQPATLTTGLVNQPTVSSAIQGPVPGPQIVTQPPPSTTQQQPQPTQYYDPLAVGSSSQLPPSVPDDPASLEDALEVIKSHAEHFSGQRHNCSSTSGDDDDDDHSRSGRGGEREKERRQANNARER